jgi:O-antigen/teichoic acid export membrane protein
MLALLRHKRLKDYSTITGGVLGRLVVSLIYFLIVANGLSLADFGIFAAASATGLVLSRLLAFGFISPVYRVATVKRRLLGVYCGGLIGLALASLPLIAGIAIGIHVLFFAGKVSLALFLAIIAAEVIGWRIVEYAAIINNGLERFGKAALVVIAGSSLRTVAALGFWLLGHATLGEWALWYLGATLLSAIGAMMFVMPPMRLRWRATLYPRRMRDAASAAGAEILFYAQSELDKLLVLTLAGPAIAGLYSIAMRIVDLTAIPVRSFNQLLVQALMRGSHSQAGSRRMLTEAGIAAVSTAGLLAVIALLFIAPNVLGKNVAMAGALFPLLLAVPAFRNLIEYHAELLYAAQQGGRRLIQLALTGLLKGALMVPLFLAAAHGTDWALWLNIIFALVYGLSLALMVRWLPARTA